MGEKGPSKRLIATFNDSTGVIDLVFFKGTKWLKDKLKINTEYIIFGKPTLFNQTINIVHPEIDLASEENPLYGGNMIGVYASTEKLRSNGFGNKQFAKFQAVLLKQSMDGIYETLPDYVISDNKLLSIRSSLQNIHFPENLKVLAKAQMRLKFEELFLLQLSLLKQKNIR